MLFFGGAGQMFDFVFNVMVDLETKMPEGEETDNYLEDITEAVRVQIIEHFDKQVN